MVIAISQVDEKDIVISGGGMVGLIAANAFAKMGLSVLLVEAGQYKDFNETSNRGLRVSALSSRNLDYLATLGVADYLLQERMGYYHSMQVWDNHSTGSLSFGANPFKHKYLGAMTENNNLINAAKKALTKYKNVVLLEQCTIQSFENAIRNVQLVLSNGSLIKCGLLIAAEGARSQIREHIGIKTKTKDYHQKGIVGYIRIENAPDKTALQGFNQTGPLGLLPMGEGLFSFVWSLSEEKVDVWMQADDGKFLAGIQKHLNRNFGTIKMLSKKAAFPLRQMYVDKFFKQRTVLCGDTAHTVHPLAGQGVNLGIEDVCSLSDLLSNVSLKDNDQLQRALKKYQRIRTSKVYETSEMMSLINKIYTSKNPIISLIRGQGMNLIDKAKPIKQWLSKQAGS
ncbi:MAG: FAD-dependent monooxygenase [Proteobacteria bacterium]|nr:FAD-dependent monooxygenase [Pseudomonadota bacterium]